MARVLKPESARKSIVARERLNNNSYQLPSEPEKNRVKVTHTDFEIVQSVNQGREDGITE